MPEEQVSRCSKCLYYCRAVATFIFSHIGLMSLVVGYTIMGAFTFEALEAEFERNKTYEMRVARNAVVDILWELTHGQDVLHDANWSTVVGDKLRDYEKSLVMAIRKMGFNGDEENEIQWTFSGALLYSIIVITSIGYGNVAPKTRLGKVVTILYAVFGIPLMLLCMSNIGDTLAQSFKFVYWKVCCFFCVRTARARRARNSRYRRQTMMRSRPGSVRPSSHRSSRHSGGSGRYSDEVSGGSGYYGHMDDVCCKYMDDEVESYTQQRRLPHPNHLIHSQPKSSYDTGRNSPESAQLEATKVPIILNKYVLESKEDLRVDLPPSVKDGCVNNLQTAPTSNNAPRPPHRSTSMQPIQRHSSRRKHHLHHHRYHHPDDLDYDLYEVDSDDDDRGSNKEQVTVPIWLCCALVTGYICGGAVLFSVWENWNFLDASYFCFVTLTTIGFGDLVPGKSVMRDDSRTTLAICSLYLLFGMALLAMSFNLVQEQVATSMKRIGKSIGIIEDDDDDED